MPCSRRTNRRLRSMVGAIGSAAVTTAERFSVFQEEHPDAAFCKFGLAASSPVLPATRGRGQAAGHRQRSVCAVCRRRFR